MKKIFVGNFAFSMTEAELRSLFEPHGQVESVTIVTDRDTGRSRGFAFVEMTTQAEAEKAIQMFNEYEMDGRKLTVNIARPRVEGGSRGGGFRGGGSRGGYGGGSRRRY